MYRINDVIQKQIHILLNDVRYASFAAVVFSLLPYVGWCGLVVIALVTLRKGWQHGLCVLLPAVMIHVATSWISLPFLPSVINSVIVFVPCYIAACVLRIARQWRAVVGVLIFLAIVLACLIQSFLPEFIKQQYVIMQSAISELHGETLLAEFLKGSTGLEPVILANYLFGIQLVSMVLSAVCPVLMARSLQSRLFYPGAFKQELLTFRARKIDVLLLMIALVAVLKSNLIAIDILPLVLSVFVASGMSICANTLSRKQARGTMVILMLPLVFLPFVMLPFYAFVGTLGSLLDFRFGTIKNVRGE